jgi:DNA-binding CsgD family transcriptional regulator
MPSESNGLIPSSEFDAAQLSHREREVFELIGEGLTTHEIADQLKLAISTVETYRERLKVKLDVKSGPALIRFAAIWMYTHNDGTRVD